MTEIIQRKLNDSAWVRWTALILIALTMFFGYMFVDMMSPLQSMIEAQRGWTPDVFGMYGSSEFIFNVFGTQIFIILLFLVIKSQERRGKIFFFHFPDRIFAGLPAPFRKLKKNTCTRP